MSDVRHVSLPDSFFAKSKLEYSNWRFAFFREVIQNAYDAGATTLDFTIVADGDSTSIVAIDNGCGMTSDTLTNVFLCMGGSYKQNSDSVGGFGYAKSLILFAHTRYEIHTQNHLVRGSGGSYTINTDTDSGTKIQWRNGTKISVTMDTDMVDAMCIILKSYVNSMFPDEPIVITCNAVRLEMDTEDSLEPGNYDVETKVSIGTLWYEIKDKQTQSLVYSFVTVCVRGLPMYRMPVSIEGIQIRGVLNLTSNTFELLTANRDALKSSIETTLRSELQLLFADRDRSRGIQTTRYRFNITAPTCVSGSLVAQRGMDSIPSGTLPVTSPLPDYPSNFCLRVNVAKRRNIGGMTPAQISAYMAKRRVVKLAHLWKSLVYSVLGTSYAPTYGVTWVDVDNHRFLDANVESDWTNPVDVDLYFNDRRVNIGFVLGDDVEGICSASPDCYDIFINPQIFEQFEYVEDLLDVALHECAHLAAMNHSEHFTLVEAKLRKEWRRTFDVNAISRDWKDMYFDPNYSDN